MSGLNSINDFALNQYLQRRLNITDSPAPASTLAPEIMPTILAVPPSQEDRWLRGERLCGVYGSVAAVALNYGVAYLSNPANSGILVMVDRVMMQYGAATDPSLHYLERTLIPTGGVINGSVRDTRWPLSTGGAARTQAIFGIINTVTAPSINWAPFMGQRWDGSSFPDDFNDLNVVVAPGSAYIIYSYSVNQALGVTFLWRERPAQPSELV